MTDVEILEMTYEDLVTVERLEKIKNPNTGITETVRKIVYENIKCSLSKNDNQGQLIVTDGVGKISTSYKLFISPRYEIEEGDIATVTRIGKISSYLASKAFSYQSHTEVQLIYKERV